MILAAAALLLAQQAVPAPAPEPEGEEIVVRATLGHTVMLFDKGADGRLRNCRVMVSSGSERRDAQACQATPVCYEKTRDTVTECVDLAVLETRAEAPAAPAAAKPPVFDAPQFVKPQAPPSPTAIGPTGAAEESRETERQRVKLPPLPKPPSDGPVVRVTTGRQE